MTFVLIVNLIASAFCVFLGISCMGLFSSILCYFFIVIGAVLFGNQLTLLIFAIGAHRRQVAAEKALRAKLASKPVPIENFITAFTSELNNMVFMDHYTEEDVTEAFIAATEKTANFQSKEKD